MFLAGSLFLLLCLSGCALPGGGVDAEQPVQEDIRRARNYLDTIRSLGTENRFPDIFTEAAQALEQAEVRLKKEEPEAAAAAARTSIAASRRILEQFYRDTVMSLARKAQNELDRKQRIDSETPLTVYWPKLDRMTTYGNSLATDPQLVSLNQVLSDLDQVLEITAGVRASWETTLGSDISFRRGRYDLSENGREALQDFVSSVLTEARQAYPDQKIRLHVKVIGYTDALNFGVGTELVRDLSQGTEAEVPETEPERRQFLNQRLSRFRAKTIGQQIETLVREDGPDAPDIRMEIAGRGETLPASLAPPYPTSDPRRRICKIHIYATPR